MQCHSRPPRSNSPYVGTPERSSTNTTAYAALTGPPTTPRSASSATFTKGFNPTLVRFCLCRANKNATPAPLFQSHLGSILPFIAVVEAHKSGFVSIPPWFDFARQAIEYRQPAIVVSIPPWFDFARQASRTRANRGSVSIPPWFDFAKGG